MPNNTDMTIIEIVSNLGLLYTVLMSDPEMAKAMSENPMLARNIFALKRAMQILVSVDLKNEMEAMNDASDGRE